MSERKALSATEAAYVALVLEEHQALIRQADKVRDGRMAVLLKEKGVPDGATVRVEKPEGETNASLVYDA